MRFNVVVGNPPYQQSSNMDEEKFNTLKTTSLYDQFIIKAINGGADKVDMIIPSRWYNTSTSALQKLKQILLEGNHLRELVDYPNAQDIFPNVRIAGGVCYFLWDRKFTGKCKVTNSRSSTILERYFSPDEVMIRDNIAYLIIQRIKGNDQIEYIGDYISKNPFEIGPTANIMESKSGNSIRIKTSYGYGYVDKNDISNNKLLGKHKVIIGKLLAGGGDHPTDKSGRMKIISGIYQIPPEEAFGPNFLFMGAFDSEVKSKNLESYIKTRFVRFLVYSTLTGLNISSMNFTYVPLQDFSIQWTDEMLYKKYNISLEEQEYIERIIKEISYVET